MLDIGSIIKLQRTKRNMTQEELSAGIVSLSYLSKIENQKAKANPEIIQSLCNRLDIELVETPDIQLEEKCKQWYDILYDRFDKEEMIAKFEELQEVMNRSINDQTIMFEIHQIRYYVVLRDLKRALHKMNELHEMADSFNSTHKYYWNKFKGNYYSFKEKPQQSLQCYQQAEKTIRLADINESEVADLHYAISIEYSKLLNGLETINYANKAMVVFQQEYNFVRCAQCHILLGISYRRIRMNELALENYNQAMYLGKLSNNKDVIQLVYLNLGRFYSTIGDLKHSTKNYLLALNTADLNFEIKLDVFASLIQNFYQNKEYTQAKEYLQLGKEVLSLAQGKEYYKFYHYTLQVYTHLLNEELNKLIVVLEDAFLPYLKHKKDYRHLVFYAVLIASQFEKVGKYKKSTQYYKLANSNYDQLIKW
ncbi:helix-turn-helix domain-containing protein [Virgibacillus sp.]|uniref:helix-turn-helix domain-containing protein n=1 Tax=Virgibacillus sp. TaxID=1872700 RepID=UPI0017C5A3E4|nr:helix-turn-helix domain-containing protein [Virgibacillus sp.]NWO12707.1 helix-turn-helix domain-containing protein [Virgibacillus sp.]